MVSKEELKYFIKYVVQTNFGIIVKPDFLFALMPIGIILYLWKFPTPGNYKIAVFLVVGLSILFVMMKEWKSGNFKHKYREMKKKEARELLNNKNGNE